MASTTTPLQNIYYERKVATARPCYICRRDTTTVLATLKADDFVYTCEGHLTDPGFASPIASPPPPTPSGPSADEVKKVISDYETRQAKKKEKDSKADDKAAAKDKDAVSTPPPSTPSPAPTAAPTHRKYALHRQIFDMRRNEIKRREMGARAKEVGKGLPQVPRGF